MAFVNTKKRKKSGTHIIRLYGDVYLGKSQSEVPKALAITFTEKTGMFVLSSKRYKYNNATLETI